MGFDIVKSTLKSSRMRVKESHATQESQVPDPCTRQTIQWNIISNCQLVADIRSDDW